ncbi:DUF4232 domain-containing protein [Streptomyces sp. NPDC001515]
MRTTAFLRAARTTALGAVALLASLSLTACQSDAPEPYDALASATPGSSAGTPADGSGSSGGKDATASPAGQDKNDSTGSDSRSGSHSGSGSGGGTSTAKPAGGDSGGGATTTACTGANTKLAITEVKRPVNHMLLTLTNTGSKACNAYYYPALRFGEAQSVPKTAQGSKPQAVVTLDPGESAYTGVMTSSADGSGSNGYKTQDLTVGFQNRDGGFDGTGSPVSVPLARSVYVDSTLTVTYWQTGMDDALQY